MNKIPIILIVIVLLVVYGFLGFDYAKQNRERSRLLSEIADADFELSLVPLPPPHNLEEQIAEAEDRLADELTAIPSEINTSQVINNILNLAKQHNVQAIPLLTQPWATEKVGGYLYRVFRINIEAEGSFVQLNDFISSLEGSQFNTLLVEHLNIESIIEESEEETTPPERFVASVDLVVFAEPLNHY